MNKLCPIIKDKETGKEYALVQGKLLTPQEALERQIFIGFIDVAPLPEKSPITQMLVVYEHSKLEPTGDMTTIFIPEQEKPELPPQELMEKALEKAVEDSKTFSLSLSGQEGGGKNEQ
jgi:hypothetical protein